MKTAVAIRNITKAFGGVKALDGVSFDVEEKRTYGIIGPNGSGKTTLLNVINGFHAPNSGTIMFDGNRIEGLSPHIFARRGISRTFQVPKVFRKMTVFENVLVPAVAERRMTPTEAQEKALSLLRLVGLDGFKDQYASVLSGGQQKLLEFARALMCDPSVLLVDEPFVGVHPTLKNEFVKLFTSMKDSTIIMVSHETALIGRVCHTVVVLDAGKKVIEGDPREVLADPRVIEAYLGT